MSMNIAYVLPTLFRGGAEKSTLFLASTMRALGNDVTVTAIYEAGSLLDEIRSSGIPVYTKRNLRNLVKDHTPAAWLDLYYGAQVGRRRLQYDRKVLLPPPDVEPSIERWTKERIRSIAPEIVHAHQSSCLDVMRWGRECGARATVYTHHEMTGEVSDDDDLRRIRESIGWADVATFGSEAQREDFLQRIPFPRERTCVIRPRTSFTGTPGQRYHKPPPLVLGMMNNLSPVKDPMTLLRAIQLLRDQGANLRLLIAGGDPRWKPVVKQVVREWSLQSVVTFLGELRSDAEIQRFYDSIDVLVSTSVAESYSLVLTEAMECGVAVISTDVASVNEHVTEGRTGLIFRKGNVDDLVSKIMFCLDHPGQIVEMGRRGREFAVNNLSGERTIVQYRKTYEQLLRG